MVPATTRRNPKLAGFNVVLLYLANNPYLIDLVSLIKLIQIYKKEAVFSLFFYSLLSVFGARVCLYLPPLVKSNVSFTSLDVVSACCVVLLSISVLTDGVLPLQVAP